MLTGTSADIWLYGVSLGLGLLLSLPSAIGRSASHRVPGGHSHHGAGRHLGKPHHGAAQQTIHHGRASQPGQTAKGHQVAHNLPRYALLNPIAFSAFLGGFGATGLIARGAGGGLALGLVVALGCGLLMSILVFKLFVRYVLAAEGGSAPEREAAIGKIAVVTVTIPAAGLGSVAYVVAGRRQTTAARTADDSTLPPGSEVVVVGMERNIAEVRLFKSAKS